MQIERSIMATLAHGLSFVSLLLFSNGFVAFPFAVDVIRVIQSSAQDDDTRFLFSASDRRVTSHLLVKYRERLS